MQEELKRELVDDEGENQALRCFLMQYSCDRSMTLAAMAKFMLRSGWGSEYWPQFARNPELQGMPLTKAGAQLWIRHLIELERRTPVSGEVAEGCVIVPKEPTEAMIAAGDIHMDGVSQLGDAWAAMIAASPSLPGGTR